MPLNEIQAFFGFFVIYILTTSLNDELNSDLKANLNGHT